MSHRWNCPTEREARREGERAEERGYSRYRNPYREDWPYQSHCEDAERAWDRGYRDAEYRREEREAEERAAERRAAERRERERMEEQAYFQAQEEAYYASLQTPQEPEPPEEQP